jgi:hypothetical protein
VTEPTAQPGGPPGPTDNGLVAAHYVPLTDLEPVLAAQLLSALGRARIPAYLDVTPADDGTRRLFVSADERADARTIVAAVVRAAGGTVPPAPAHERASLDGVDVDAAFADLIADWHVDTVTAIRNAERALRRDDPDWQAQLEAPEPAQQPPELAWLDEHYVPPPPPPLPRLAAPTITAMAVIALSILVLGLGGELGLADKLTLLLGVLGLLLGAGILLMRLRDRPDDDDDDGAVV